MPPDASLAHAESVTASAHGRVAHGAAAVDCRELVVRYGARTAVDGLSLTAHAGEVVAVLGPNGAGKTSTIECLEGYRRPAAGSVRVLGMDPIANHRALVPHIGVMLQRGGVYPMLGPRRALELFASYYDDPSDPVELLALTGLTAVARTPFRHLSGGEQARLSLALALVGRPAVAFLDEPTAGVDPEGRLAVRDVVLGMRERGTCIVLATHELSEAERLADRVVIVQRGSVVAEGTPAALASSAAGGEVLSWGAEPGLDVDALSAALGAPVAEEPPGRYRVSAPPSPALTAALTAWLAARDLTLTDLRVGRSLEEAYLAVIGSTSEPTDPERPGPRGGGPGRRRSHGRDRGGVGDRGAGR